MQRSVDDNCAQGSEVPSTGMAPRSPTFPTRHTISQTVFLSHQRGIPTIECLIYIFLRSNRGLAPKVNAPTVLLDVSLPGSGSSGPFCCTHNTNLPLDVERCGSHGPMAPFSTLKRSRSDCHSRQTNSFESVNFGNCCPRKHGAVWVAWVCGRQSPLWFSCHASFGTSPFHITASLGHSILLIDTNFAIWYLLRSRPEMQCVGTDHSFTAVLFVFQNGQSCRKREPGGSGPVTCSSSSSALLWQQQHPACVHPHFMDSPQRFSPSPLPFVFLCC